MKLSRSAGARLRPQLRLLVPALLEALSTLESASVRHVSVAVGHEAERQETVDRARLSITKDSLMFKTLCQVGCCRRRGALARTTLRVGGGGQRGGLQSG